MASGTRKLYRPVGLLELDLILQADARAFPPRLPEQPIFYPVLNFDYAAQIARQWNPKDERSGYAGFVTVFDVDQAYAEQFEVHTVGASMHQELWIPAQALDEFNAHIRGRIQVREAFYGDAYEGLPGNAGKNALAQLMTLFDVWTENPASLHSAIQRNRNALIANYKFWMLHVSPEEISKKQKSAFLHDIAEKWMRIHPAYYLPGSETLVCE